jgi:hypothetical protein
MPQGHEGFGLGACAIFALALASLPAPASFETEHAVPSEILAYTIDEFCSAVRISRGTHLGKRRFVTYRFNKPRA